MPWITPSGKPAEAPEEQWYRMQWNVCQTINIHYLRVEAVTNSSVLQIGSAGSIRALSQLFNTGGFTGPAPQIGAIAESEISLARLPDPAQ